MPVTVRLSRLFHERLGDEIADELANWFNQVDATYRGDLRELNELNFARFDAKLEQRIAQVESKLEQRMAQLESKLEQRVAQLEAKLGQRITEVEARIERSADQLRAEFAAALADVRSRLMTWMVGLWVTSVLGFASVLIAVLRSR